MEVLQEEYKGIQIKRFFDNKSKPTNILLAIHGFLGDSDSSVISRLAQEVTGENFVVIAFDLPCHGKDCKNGILKLQDCLDYLSTLEDYISTLYNNLPTSILATSFGAYLFLRWLETSTYNFKHIFLRAPAVFMADVLKDVILPQHGTSLTELKSQNIELGYERKLTIDYGFYKDIKEHKLLGNERAILNVIQGKKDDVVNYINNEKFFKKEFKNRHKIYYLETADHRFKNNGELDYIVSIMKQVLTR